MRIGGPGLRGGLLAGLAVMGFVCPAMSAADEIRILFVTPRDIGLEVQVGKLQQAIRDSKGPLATTESLIDAHVVVQFIEYRRSIGAEGKPLFTWLGQVKLLKMPEEMSVSATPLPERFQFLVIGEDGKETRPPLKSLEEMLTRTLRPRAPTPVKDAL